MEISTTPKLGHGAGGPPRRPLRRLLTQLQFARVAGPALPADYGTSTGATARLGGRKTPMSASPACATLLAMTRHDEPDREEPRVLVPRSAPPADVAVPRGPARSAVERAARAERVRDAREFATLEAQLRALEVGHPRGAPHGAPGDRRFRASGCSATTRMLRRGPRASTFDLS